MNRLTLLLGALLLVIQWPLWFGHGGWLRVWDLQHQLEVKQSSNAALRARNQALGAELASLRQGSEAIEERARKELHMIRPDETFFQFVLAPGGGQASGDEIASSQALQFGAE